jgi:hypothetical protein
MHGRHEVAVASQHREVDRIEVRLAVEAADQILLRIEVRAALAAARTDKDQLPSTPLMRPTKVPQQSRERDLVAKLPQLFVGEKSRHREFPLSQLKFGRRLVKHILTHPSQTLARGLEQTSRRKMVDRAGEPTGEVMQQFLDFVVEDWLGLHARSSDRVRNHQSIRLPDSLVSSDSVPSCR